MNGIRYLSGRIGASHTRLFSDIPKNWCSKARTIGDNLNLSRSRRFCDSANGSCVNDETVSNNDETCKIMTRQDLKTGPSLADFMSHPPTIDNRVSKTQTIPYLKNLNGGQRRVYFDVHGCQMNVNDTDVVWAILKRNGYRKTKNMEFADIVLVVTCAIREGAEGKIWHKLDYLKGMKAKREAMENKHPLKIGILGCMAERLKDKILEINSAVDVVAGPDSYRDLPRLLACTTHNETAINVILSFDETYADITPVSISKSSISAYVTIMRGCDNMCTYCIVPFTRGRERSRPISSILDEIHHLSELGVKEVTLLGQNVNSYRDMSQSNFYPGEKAPTNLAKGFKTVYKSKIGGVRFSDLLEQVSLINPEMRIRFTSPHPKDFPDEVLHLISERPNICQQLHLPAQSGNSEVLERMGRGYTREAYVELVDRVRNIIPNVTLSSDFIAGFCNETEEQFEETMTLIEQVKYHKAFLFAYSLREKTKAHRRYEDNVEPEVKNLRLQRMIKLCKSQADVLNSKEVGSQQLVLIEGKGRKMNNTLVGRNDGNTRVVIPNAVVPTNSQNHETRSIQRGDYVVVQIYQSNCNTLSGIPLYHSSISEYEPLIEVYKQTAVGRRDDRENFCNA